MRLTLRTLLAYLDDTLDPAEAKNIGQKVAESSAAQELVERIKKVTRRRSLANPSIFAEESKLDPNTVAAYLSDVLSADEVSEVEQTCLQHDVYLAEVAACHQILTLMLSEPVRVPPTARQRMYRLVKGRESIPYRRPPAFQPALDANSKIAQSEADRPKSGRWLRYLAAVLVLSVGLAVSVWLAWPTRQPAVESGQGDVVVAMVPPSAIPTNKVKVDVPKADVPKNDPPKADLPKSDPPKNDPVKADPPKNDPVKADPVKADPPKSDPAKADPPKVDSPKPNIGKVVASEPSKSKRELGRLVSPEAIFLQRPAGSKSWTRVASDARVSAGVDLIAMPGSRAELKLDTGVIVNLAGNVPEFVEAPHLECAATLYAPPEGFDADFLLDRGRIILVNPRGKPAVVRVRFLSEVWDVTMGEQGEILIDLLQSYPQTAAFSKHPGGDGPMTEVFLGALKGRVDVARKDLPALVTTAPSLIAWNSNRGEVIGPKRLNGLLPFWLPAPANRPVAAEARAAQDDFSKRMAANADVEVALTEMQQDPKPALQALGAFGLGAIGDVADLLDALDEPNRLVLRGAAIISLRHWCARKAENDLILYNMLRSKKNYSETNADLVLELLHDFSPAAVQKPQTYQLLFGYLNHDRLAIRTLAFWHLAKLDPGGEKVALYDPDADDSVREKAISAWRKRIPKDKLPPPPPRPTP